jgi:hypothetical protein
MHLQKAFEVSRDFKNFGGAINGESGRKPPDQSGPKWSAIIPECALVRRNKITSFDGVW